MKIFSLILSIIIYLFSPDEYNFYLCLFILVLFIFSFISEVKRTYKSEGYLNFTTFFSISFLFVNFFYPVFIFPVNKDYFLVFSRFTFDENVINKSTALALIGYNSFIVGKNWVSHRLENNIQRFKVNFVFVYGFIKYSTWLFLFLLIFLARDGISKGSSDAFFTVEPSILVITQCLINLLIIFTFSQRKSFINLFPAFIYSLIFLYVGDRGSIIQTGLVLLISYNLFVKRINGKYLISLIIVGAIIMTIISSIRGKEGTQKNISEVEFANYYDFAMDLIVNNRNLYAGYEYVQKYGINYGQGAIPYIFSPIPLLPSFISNTFFDKTPQELSSGMILTNEAEATWGLGTNLIIDLYMQFSLLGVLLFMWVLGLIVNNLENINFNNFFKIICYIFLFSFSIYMPRSSMFDAIRYIAWAGIILGFITLLLKPFIKIKGIR